MGSAKVENRSYKIMNLYFLRHGIAVEFGENGITRDEDRPLTSKGERKLWRIAEAMEAMELKFDAILSSPILRARQTADIISEAFNGRKKVQHTQALVPHSKARELVDLVHTLTPRPDNILLVGHEPFLSELICLLVFGQHTGAVRMKKGGLCLLTADSLRAGKCATLEWLLTPAQMALMHG
jgi:phosphohistidine phosphatase